MTRQRYYYSQLLEQWWIIFQQPLSDADKHQACLDLLRAYLHRKAISHIRHPDPGMRFYADMVVLRADLTSRFATDGFAKLVILPLYNLVDDWVRTHTAPPNSNAGTSQQNAVI
jgi:hypothetical protein